jgi:biopolymer transport protein ExbD
MQASGAEAGDDDLDDIHEINVTPFIDVMLVLLIIFMVAAPLSTVDIAVDLPSSSVAPVKRPDKPVYLTLKADLGVAIGETDVPRETLLNAVDAASASEAGKDTRLFLRADRVVSYGELMKLLEALRLGGYRRVSLVAEERASPAAPSSSAMSAP